MKRSIACIAYQNRKVLIALRNPVGQMGNRWEFPGGKVDGDESDEIAIQREMKEEFGIDVKVKEKITEGEFFHNEKKSLLEVYHILVPHDGMTERYVLTEHQDYKWVDINDIPEDNFVDSDLSIYPEVKKFISSLEQAK